jgi:TRAP transporter TAXI family solute receptor
VISGEAYAALGLGTGNVVYEAYHGAGRFEKRGKQPLLAIGARYPNAIQIATLKDSGIEGLTDLKGKCVSVGAPGSGIEALNRDVFGAVGITYDQFETAARLSYAETTSAMKDGNLDAGSPSLGLGARALTDLASTRDMALVCMQPGETEAVTGAFPYYSAFVIPANTYPGVDHDCATIQVANGTRCGTPNLGWPGQGAAVRGSWRRRRKPCADGPAETGNRPGVMRGGR